MSARDILHRVEELIDAEIAGRVRNARANAIGDCAVITRAEADRIDPQSMTRRADAVGVCIGAALRELASKLESIR